MMFHVRELRPRSKKSSTGESLDVEIAPPLTYRFSVPHDRLFLDALERDLKREKVQQAPTTETVGEPARSFR